MAKPRSSAPKPHLFVDVSRALDQYRHRELRDGERNQQRLAHVLHTACKAGITPPHAILSKGMHIEC
jgi:hypothetical protein